MGLFGGKRDLCPICGNPTPRIFHKSVDNTPICKGCSEKIHLPKGRLEEMSLDDFRQYLVFYDDNASLRKQFQKEYVFNDFEAWSSVLEIDFTHNLFRLNFDIVFEGSQIRSFQIKEDTRPLYEGDADSLRCYVSQVPERLQQIQPLITQYIIEKREYERMKMMKEMMDEDDKTYTPYISEPHFNPPMPVTAYEFVLTLDHPYWPEFKGALSVPSFGLFEPDPADYMKSYEKKSSALDEMAKSLIRLFAPEAPIQQITSGGAQPAATAPPVDAVAEIQRYKGLLDAGVISEDEFTAKKRQLLGIN